MGDKQSEILWLLFTLGFPFLDKSLANMVSVVTILQMFYDAFTFWSCGGACNGIKDKQDTNRLLKTQNFGLMKTIGNGLQTNQEKKVLSKIFYPCRKADNWTLLKDQMVIF
jgi:hypothetical protein